MTAVPQITGRRRTVAAATLLAAASAATIGGAAFAAGTAEAATTPTINVVVEGANHWRASWTSAAAKCDLYVNGQKNWTGAGTANIVISPAAYPDKEQLVTGQNKARVICGGNWSNTVFFYAQRDPLNDLRTAFSNSTQGAFGS